MMKKTLQTILAIALISLGFTSSAQTRYLDDVFSSVTVTSNIDYATNISILPMLQGLPPGPATLKCDIYEPTGDSVINRPVIILIHTGTFLPPIANGQPTGSKTDLSIVEQCSRWAKKGYVAVAMENRLGWNPTSTDQDVRTSTLLQAAYRGIQDAKAMVRYMRMTEDNGNPHGINPDKIILGGQGTGGYLSLGYATLNDPGVELMLPKFINFQDPANPTPYVFPPFFGNPDGTDSTYLPDFASPTGQTELWNIPNNPSYSNDVNMVFNLGGALADISWLEAGEVPMVSFHCENDPNAPIDTGDVVEPVNNDFVIEVMGSRTAQFYANQYLNNDAFALAGISDAFTTAANVNNGGLEGLYVFKTPAPSTGTNAYGQNYTEEGAPWDWWDNASYEAIAQVVNGPAPAGYFAADAITGNPGMSAAKGNAYLDTVHGYLNPRMYEVLSLVSNSNVLGIYGCTDVTACNYDATANSDDSSCDLPNGCGDVLYLEYDASVTCSDANACITLIVNGCTDMTACNYNSVANVDDGSCDLPNGCGDPLYVEYDANVTCSDPAACITLIATGVNEVIDASTEIYPNPANNVLTIVSHTVGIENIYIYNTTGQLVLANEVNTNQIRLNTSTLSIGIYIVDIRSKETSIKRKLIIE